MDEPMQPVIVKAAYDDEARVWFIAYSSLEGLRGEAATVEALRDRLPGLVEDLIEANKFDVHGNVAIELYASMQTLAHAAA